jgi:hypothetical protein
MSARLSELHDPAAVQAALDECTRLGRQHFLQRYGFSASRDYLVRDPKTGELYDSKAIVGAAFGYRYPGAQPLKPAQFSGGMHTVAAKLQALGFEVVRIGQDWSEDEVQATVRAYFEMLRLDAADQPYVKTEFNARLRTHLGQRSKAAVELKFQNISGILDSLDQPYIPGYKPRGHAQLLLRKMVQQHIQRDQGDLARIVDALQELTPQADRRFTARVVDPPTPVELDANEEPAPRPRLPRKIDYAARDAANRSLGRSGEQWALTFEQRRLHDEGQGGLFERVDWISDRLGDGAGYDILSFDAAEHPRYIEVKTTNAGHSSPFVISHNELTFSREVAHAFALYRLFDFRRTPTLYILRGDVSRHVRLDPIDYRASFRRLRAAA